MAGALSGLLVFGCVTPALGAVGAEEATAEEETETAAADAESVISIGTTQDFMAFMEGCVSESYSRGKTFCLTADINLGGIPLTPAPVFAGTFLGNGHRIADIDISESGSDQGLFRFVEEGAVIRELSLSGTVAPKGSGSRVGGLAGTNRGLLEQVSFSGQVTGQEDTGGLVGKNEASGILKDCVNEGEINGNRKTGGIVGNNEGQITGCVNDGPVNITSVAVEKENQGVTALDKERLGESFSREQINDAGGIAGYSQGVISDCENRGDVGAAHTGYNLGGIAGRQSGQVLSSKNSGRIRGRKDVGGITGQFEPYITIDYEEDLFGHLSHQLDQLSEIGKSMVGSVEDTGDKTGESIREIGTQVDRIRDTSRSYVDLLKEDGDFFSSELRSSLDVIGEVFDGMDLTVLDSGSRKKLESLKKDLKRQRELSEKLKENYPGDPADTEALRQWLLERKEMLLEMKELAASIEQTGKELLESIFADAGEWGDDLHWDVENLRDEASVMTRIIENNLDWISTDLEDMSRDVREKLDLVSDQMDQISDDLSAGKEELRLQRQVLENQIDEIRNTISDEVEKQRQGDEELLEDVSDTALEPGNGLIESCENAGQIEADHQAGGIAGIIGMEMSLDPEQDLELEGEKTLNVTGQLRAIVRECINEGPVQVKNQYAGGIVGKAQNGALFSNENYGDVLTEEGAYVGGVTGSSDSTLQHNYAMCTISGKKYVGGIAGKGTNMEENCAMVTLLSKEGEKLGTIAGEGDPDGHIASNSYVQTVGSLVGAIDGVTYEEQAAAMDYETFIQMEHVPERFRTLTVTFLVEGEPIKTLNCAYGDAVSSEQIPVLPQKDGYYYEWEEKDLSCVTANQQVEAVYKPWDTTIASSNEKKPKMLLDANFYPGTSLVVKNVESAGLKAPRGYSVKEVCEFQVYQPEKIPLPETMTVRLLAESTEKGYAAGVAEQGSVRLLDSRRDGDYLVFQVNGPETVVLLEEKKPLWIPVAGAVCALVLAVFWFFKRKSH